MAVTTTNAPAELVEFVQQVKAAGLRFYKGEFVTTDGVHIPCDFAFERAPEQRRGQRGSDDG